LESSGFCPDNAAGAAVGLGLGLQSAGAEVGVPARHESPTLRTLDVRSVFLTDDNQKIYVSWLRRIERLKFAE
jgi:hypothetical protein